MEIFKMNDVKKTFQNGEIQENILNGINLTLKEGEITALVGASGSGKSTLLTIAAGLQGATAGQVLYDGKNMATMSPESKKKNSRK